MQLSYKDCLILRAVMNAVAHQFSELSSSKQKTSESSGPKFAIQKADVRP